MKESWYYWKGILWSPAKISLNKANTFYFNKNHTKVKVCKNICFSIIFYFLFIDFTRKCYRWKSNLGVLQSKTGLVTPRAANTNSLYTNKTSLFSVTESSIVFSAMMQKYFFLQIISGVAKKSFF